MSVRPDSVRVTYTTAPGVSLPIIINADVHPSLQSIINGPITANVDSVKVYGINGGASVTDASGNRKIQQGILARHNKNRSGYKACIRS